MCLPQESNGRDSGASVQMFLAKRQHETKRSVALDSSGQESLNKGYSHLAEENAAWS